MDKIKLCDIDFNSLKKLSLQGTKGTIYSDGDICIKMLNGLYPEEKQALYKKILEMDGLSIDNVLLPIDLIVQDDNLVGYTMEYFKNSVPLSDYFGRIRYVNCKDMFKAVKQASLILRNIHNSGIICQDLSFENVIIDENGVVKYCDMDGCIYNTNITPFISVLLHRFMEYRKGSVALASENTDRISFMLSFYLMTYGKELQKLSRKEYHRLSDHVATLENCRDYANILVSRNGAITTSIPYMDELIDENDDYVIDRGKQLSLVRRIIGR